MAVVPYKEVSDTKKVQVRQMFNNIAFRYDFLNRLLSFGIDVWWRKQAVKQLKPIQPKRILDVATGTADLAIEALSLKPNQIIGIDISDGMLDFGKQKIAKAGYQNTISLEVGDSENLRFETGYFDAVMVSFGVRNFENLEKGLSEMLRVTKAGGRVVVLEFSQPTAFPIKQLYGFYSKYILPAIGKLFSSDNSAYTYLPESVAAFPSGEAFLNVYRTCGYKNVKAIPLLFGIVSLYVGEK